jgi:Glycosyl hydrolases family 31
LHLHGACIACTISCLHKRSFPHERCDHHSTEMLLSVLRQHQLSNGYTYSSTRSRQQHCVTHLHFIVNTNDRGCPCTHTAMQHRQATSKGYYIKDASGTHDFDGWCWSGSSSYLDFTSAAVREWWAQHYSGSTHNLHIWNDMNEPSVFNGPEASHTYF